MKTGDFAKVLNAFAGLADANAGDQLQQLAQFLADGKDESVAQRLKKSGAPAGYPQSLRRALEMIRKGFEQAGAKKQVASVDTLLTAFSGAADLTVAEFVAALRTPPPKPKRKATAKQGAAAQPNPALARSLADELQKYSLEAEKFADVIAQLKRAKEINTPTLHLIAHQFLGNSKRYSGRKAPIDDIIKRQQEDARDHALERALDRVAV